MEVKKTATSAAPKASVAADKGAIEKSLKNSANITDLTCDLLNKKILSHKNASLSEIAEVGGINKNEIMKLIEILDEMGSTTYRTACALRELHSKMK